MFLVTKGAMLALGETEGRVDGLCDSSVDGRWEGRAETEGGYDCKEEGLEDLGGGSDVVLSKKWKSA